jgi:hypothetical protein
MFKIGDRVKCVDCPNYGGVEEGAIYTVLSMVGEEDIFLQEAPKLSWKGSRFVLMPSISDAQQIYENWGNETIIQLLQTAYDRGVLYGCSQWKNPTVAPEPIKKQSQYYIFNVKTKQYMHDDGLWYESMRKENGEYAYFATELLAYNTVYDFNGNGPNNVIVVKEKFW